MTWIIKFILVAWPVVGFALALGTGDDKDLSFIERCVVFALIVAMWPVLLVPRRYLGD